MRKIEWNWMSNGCNVCWHSNCCCEQNKSRIYKFERSWCL